MNENINNEPTPYAEPQVGPETLNVNDCGVSLTPEQAERIGEHLARSGVITAKMANHAARRALALGFVFGWLGRYSSHKK